MSLDALPQFVLENYEVLEWHHATAILEKDFPEQWGELCRVLVNFRLLKSHIVRPGGRKSPVAMALDSALYADGWTERCFDTRQQIDGVERISPTHSIDCFKDRIGVEIEWNNKDPFFDRDLNNFRLLFDLQALSVGVIITRCTELQDIFNRLGRGASYGSSTTHFGKLRPKLLGAGSGGCPVLALGIKPSLYVDDMPGDQTTVAEPDMGAETLPQRDLLEDER
jgi:hypothetical protein